MKKSVNNTAFFSIYTFFQCIMKKDNQITEGEILDMTMRYLDSKILSGIRLSFGTLFLEFWNLDTEWTKWEITLMVRPSWRFQRWFHIKETSDWDKNNLETSLPQYLNKRLRHFAIDPYLLEISLDFWDIYFSTLSTFNTEILWRSLFFNEHLNGSDSAKWCLITPGNEWFHYHKWVST